MCVLKGAEIETDVVMANVDPKYLYGHMLDRATDLGWQKLSIMRCRWACLFCFRH